MAFQQDIPTAKPLTGIQGAPADKSLSVLLGGATDAAQLLGGIGAAINEDQLDIQTDQIAGDALSGLLDLEEERDFARGIDKRVADRTREFAADGRITSEEREQLQALEVEKGFLDQAKRTGVLSRQGYSTRFNTLRRSALSNAENLGIQTEINQLFMANRSLVEGAPVEDPAQKAVTGVMDAQFGLNNWTATQAAEFTANKVRSTAIMQGIETQAASLAGAMQVDMTVLTNSFLTDAESRGIITADEQQTYILSLDTKVTESLKQLDQKRQLLRTEGLFTVATEAKLQAATDQLLATRDAYGKVFDEGERHGNLTAQEALKRTQIAIESMNNLNLSMSSPSLVGTGSGNGVGGKMSADLMMRILQEDPKQSLMLQVLAENSAIPGITGAKLHAQVAEVLANYIGGGASLEDSHRAGQINSDTLRYFSANLTAQKVATPEESKEQQNVNNAMANVGANIRDTSANTQVLVQVFDKEASDSKSNGTVSAHKANTLDRIKRLSIDIQDKARAKSSLTVSINDEGLPTVELRPEFGGDLGIVPAGAKRADEELRELLANFGALNKKALEEGYLTPSDIQKHFGTGKQVFDITTGAAETVGALERREEVEAQADVSSIVTLPEGITETVDKDVAVAIRLESDGDPDADNGASGLDRAVGLLQITGHKLKDLPEGTDPTDPNTAIQVFKEHTESVKPLLTSIGEEPSGFNAYLLWQQGRRGGVDILTSQDLKISSLSKARQRNLASNPPPTKGWETAKGKEGVKVSKWVAEWEKHYNRLASQG